MTRQRWTVVVTMLVLFAVVAHGVASAQAAVATAGVAAGKGTHELIVSAAMSLKDGLAGIVAAFEKARPGVHVAVNFGGSGALATQIEQGAPVDVFVSADHKDVLRLDGKGLLASGSAAPWIRNALVVVTLASAPVQVASLTDLPDARIKRIAVGNPATVPAGRYAAEAMTAAGVRDRVADRLVMCENVRQVLDYVVRGEVDAGFVFATDARTRAAELRLLAVPANLHVPIVYGTGVVAASTQHDLAAEFVAFLRTGEAVQALETLGFVAPAAP